MAAQFEPTMNDYLAMLRRRAIPAGIAFVTVLVVSAAFAILLPPTYRATGTIMVESPQISQDLIASTITSMADERIMVIKQRVMTQSNLRNIIDKYDLFADERKSAPASEIMDMMRKRISVELINTDATNGKKNTIAFTVSYDDPRAEVSYQVANDILTLFLDENVKARTARASETTVFMTEEADKLRKDLDASDAAIAAYKQKHGDSLPEHLDMRRQMLSRADTDLQELQRAYNDVEAQSRMLDIELGAVRSGKVTTVVPGQAPVASPEQQLAAMKTELAKISATYSPNHPTLRDLKRKIAALERTISQTPAAAETSDMKDDSDLAAAKIQAQIQAARARMASIAQQMKSLRAQRSDDERSIMQTPLSEQGMAELLRDHDNIKAKYQEVQAKQMSAQISQSLETEKKAERFTLLEPPLLPDTPIEPNRKKIGAMGFFLALASSGGMVMLLETIQQRIFGIRALASVLGYPPLVAIPFIQVEEVVVVRERPKRRWWLLLIVAVLVIAAGLAAVNFLYQPLDMLWFKFLSRFE